MDMLRRFSFRALKNCRSTSSPKIGSRWGREGGGRHPYLATILLRERSLRKVLIRYVSMMMSIVRSEISLRRIAGDVRSES